MMTVTMHTTAAVVWRASSVAHGLERHELGERLSEMATHCEKGREFLELELWPVDFEFVRVVSETMSCET